MASREGEGEGTCISVNVFIVLIPIRIIYFREILSIRVSNLVPFRFFSFRFSRDFIRDPIIVKEFLYVGERICASGNFFRGELKNEKVLILKFEKVGDDK